MKKLKIKEIENSYLNLFTPAAIIAAGIFLYKMISWPLSGINWFLSVSYINFNRNLIEIIIAILICILICYVSYYHFIPRLKVKESDYIDPKWSSAFIIFPVFFIIMFFRLIITFFFEYLGTTINIAYPWFLNTYSELQDPLILLLYIFYQFFIVPIFSELIYRRTVIPLLEDRGASPKLAVILSSLGFCLLFLPEYLNPNNPISSIYWFLSTFLFGVSTGIIYILTRNILFSILYSILYYCYRIGGEIGTFFSIEIIIITQYLINLVIVFSGIALIAFTIWSLIKSRSPARWITVIKATSAPKIQKGIIGYILITIILVGSNLFVITCIDNAFGSNIQMQFLLNTLFYLIAFSIPYWLSITTEYATS